MRIPPSQPVSPIYLAEKTLSLINERMVADQGATYRGLLSQTLPAMGDAYSTDDFPFRSHLGASLIGAECERQTWYSFRWVRLNKFNGKMLRLFNRGHLEEGRLIALLLMIGVEVYQQDENENQFRVTDCNGHFGGSSDGIGIGIPDLPPKTKCLLEFKTAADKYFKQLVAKGCLIEKRQHYIQMQIYMYKMGLQVALYMVVNKNTDELYAELIAVNPDAAKQYIERASALIYYDSPPKGISKNPGWYKCKWCDYHGFCFGDKVAKPTCRSCRSASIIDDGKWMCTLTGELLSKEKQLEGCAQHDGLC